MGPSTWKTAASAVALVGWLAAAGAVRAQELVTFRGKAIFNGDPARFDPAPIEAVQGTACQKRGRILTESVLVNKNTSPPTLRNVIVWLAHGPVDMRTMAPKEALKLEMVDCRIEPRVLTAFIRQRVLVENLDPIPHTFRTHSTTNKPQGVTLPKPKMPISLAFFDAEEPFRIQSEQYPWMTGWIAVFDHPYYLLTDDRGTFEFKDFPTGQYTFKAWHEVFGTKTLKIQASPGKETNVDFVFGPERNEPENDPPN